MPIPVVLLMRNPAGFRNVINLATVIVLNGEPCPFAVRLQ